MSCRHPTEVPVLQFRVIFWRVKVDQMDSLKMFLFPRRLGLGAEQVCVLKPCSLLYSRTCTSDALVYHYPYAVRAVRGGWERALNVQQTKMVCIVIQTMKPPRQSYSMLFAMQGKVVVCATFRGKIPIMN